MKLSDLSTEEKVILAQQIWDSVRDDQGSRELSARQKQHLDEKLSQFQLDGEKGSSFDEVKQRIVEN